jgi:hypothetical protein
VTEFIVGLVVGAALVGLLAGRLRRQRDRWKVVAEWRATMLTRQEKSAGRLCECEEDRGPVILPFTGRVWSRESGA